MLHVRHFVGVVVLVLVIAGWAVGQDEKPKAKGFLPQNYGKLGLSEEQKQKIYTIQAEYRGKVEALEKQIKDLQKQQAGEFAKVLTPSQRTRLKEIISAKVPGDSEPASKTDKK
jgi:hypothetical protein